MLPRSSCSTQPSRISRAAIQSVITMMSQPVSWPASSCGLIVPRNVVVVVDDLLVLDRRPVLGLEVLERLELRLVVRVDVHVVGPVGPVELGRGDGFGVGLGDAAGGDRGARPTVGGRSTAADGAADVPVPFVPQAARNDARNRPSRRPARTGGAIRSMAGGGVRLVVIGSPRDRSVVRLGRSARCRGCGLAPSSRRRRCGRGTTSAGPPRRAPTARPWWRARRSARRP